MKRFLIFLFPTLSLIIIGVLSFVFLASSEPTVTIYPKPDPKWWAFQSVDTMKHSRDLAREKLHDDSYDAVIDREVRSIADIGATHVAIATPYDEEFVPYLKRWVSAARKYHLAVWFRGNFSGGRSGSAIRKYRARSILQKPSRLFVGIRIYSKMAMRFLLVRMREWRSGRPAIERRYRRLSKIPDR